MHTDYEELDTWLRDNGYEHWCFISWPFEPELQRFAERLRERLAADLSLYCGRNKRGVFLDSKEIREGSRWEQLLGKCLCSSVVLIPIYTPNFFFRNEHDWCKFEWGAMHRLSTRRLGNSWQTCFFPVSYRNPGTLPPLAASVQIARRGADFSWESVRRSDPENSAEFEQLVYSARAKILDTARLLRERNARSACSRFKIVRSSPFEDRPRPSPLPIGRR